MATTQVRGQQVQDESIDFAVDVKMPVAVISSGTTLSSSQTVILCDTSGGVFTVTLPTAVHPSSTQQNGIYRIKNTGTNALSIATTSSQTIDGYAAPLILSFLNSSVDLVSDGSNWSIQ